MGVSSIALPGGRMRSGRPLTASLGASLAVQALNVMTGVLLARALGPAGRGELTAVMLWPTLLAAVGSLGMAEAVTYHLAGRAFAPDRVVGAGLAVALAQSAVLLATSAAVVSVALAHYGPDALRS